MNECLSDVVISIQRSIQLQFSTAFIFIRVFVLACTEIAPMLFRHMTVYSGVAGPLAAQGDGQICRPFALLGRPFAAKDPT